VTQILNNVFRWYPIMHKNFWDIFLDWKRKSSERGFKWIDSKLVSIEIRPYSFFNVQKENPLKIA